MAGWQLGTVLAEGQNMARKLMEMPANILTPSHFGYLANSYLHSYSDTEVIIR